MPHAIRETANDINKFKLVVLGANAQKPDEPTRPGDNLFADDRGMRMNVNQIEII